MGTIHFAKLDNSPRLQRLLMLLSDGREYSTMEIVHRAQIVAVNSAVSELRFNDVPVNCRQTFDGDSRIYKYRLAEFAEAV